MLKTLAKCFIFLTFFTSCYKDHLYVQQEWVDRNFLASTHVGSPDPRSANPPTGQRLLIAWRFPRNLTDEGLKLILRVRFWDNSEKEYEEKIDQKKGYAAFNFFDQKVLTYLIEVINMQGEVIEVWEHQFWTKLIDVESKSF